MVCQNCGKNEDNVKYTQIVNGVKKEMVLCEECAEKMGISNFKVNMPIHFSNFFDDLFDDEQLLPSFMKENSNTCTNCGEEYDNFIKTGLLGCADCYDMFEDKIDQVLKNMQGSIKHVGRKPLNIEEKMKNTGENKANVNSQNSKAEKDKKVSQVDELESLKRELNVAIQEERYEDAAKIRDKIKDIEKKNAK